MQPAPKWPNHRILGLFLSIGIGLFGGSSAYGQSYADAGKDATQYLGWERTSLTTRNGFDLRRLVDGDYQSSELEHDGHIVHYMLVPRLGAGGFFSSTRISLSVGSEKDTVTVSDSYLDLNESGRFERSFDYAFRGTISYEEAGRLAASYLAFYSVAERFHSYVSVGYYHTLDPEYEWVGTFNGICRGDWDEKYTEGDFGFTYGGGLVVHLTKKIALTASYEFHGGLSFDYRSVCDDKTYTWATFDSEVESYGLGFAVVF